MTSEIDKAIAEITGVTGKNRVFLAGDIGRFVGETEVEWRFEKDGRYSPYVKLPRVAFTYVREYDRTAGYLVNFWLVEMARPAAVNFGIADFILTDAEAVRHKTRILGTEGHLHSV